MTNVVIGARDVEVSLRPRARHLQCPCGMRASAVYDRRRRRWRHLDLATHRLWLVYEIRRLDCPDCGVRTEEVPWARPGARHTRDFEDVVVWLAQRTDRTSVATLMRCSWDTVTAIIDRECGRAARQPPVENLYRIGVDEVCYRHPHKYLTIIGNHDTGTVVDIQPGRSDASLSAFYQCQPIRRSPTSKPSAWTCPRPHRSHPQTCPPRRHLLRRVPHHAMGQPRTRSRLLRIDYRPRTGRPDTGPMARRTLGTTYRREQTHRRQTRPAQPIARTNRRIGRAWTLKEQLRELYRIEHPPGGARQHLKRWITAAKRSRIPAFVALGKRLQIHMDAVIAAVELGLSNALIEGINAKIRLINARGYGHHSAETLTSMIYLTLGGLHPELPTRT